MAKNLSFLVKNTFWLTTAEIFTKLATLAVNIWLARKLGGSDFGALSFALALVMLAVYLGDLGLSTFLVREVAHQPKKLPFLFSASLILRSISAIVSFFILQLAIPLLNQPHQVKTILRILSALIFIYPLIDVTRGVFRGTERMGYEAIVKVSQTTVLILGLYVISIWGFALTPTTLIYVLASLVALGLSLFLLKTFIPSLVLTRVSWSGVRSVFGQAWPFTAMAVTNSLYGWLDTILLGVWRGNLEVGWYSAAYQFFNGLAFLPNIIGAASLPRLTNLRRTDMGGFKKTYLHLSLLIFLLAFGVSLTLGLASRSLIQWLYGTSFLPASTALRILAIAIGLNFLSWNNVVGLAALGEDRFNAFFLGSVAVVNALLNLLLIPNFGFIGSAWAMLASESFRCLISYSVILRKVAEFR